MTETANVLATPDSRDPIARMRVYQLAVELLVEAWGCTGAQPAPDDHKGLRPALLGGRFD